MGPSPFHRIFSAFDTAEEELSTKTPAGAAAPSGVGQIAVDIYEIENYTIIRAPIAGVKLSDIDIEVDDRVLTIRGIRKAADAVPEHRYYLQECYWGEFKRSITLPFAIDPRKVKATFSKDCILKILIPKEEKVKIVRINEV